MKIMSNKTWEEYKELIFQELEKVEVKTVSEPLLREILKEADSQIEKARTRGREEGIGVKNIGKIQTEYHNWGYRKAIEKAIDLVPKALSEDHETHGLYAEDCAICCDAGGFNDCRQQVLENLKKEMEK